MCLIDVSKLLVYSKILRNSLISLHIYIEYSNANLLKIEKKSFNPSKTISEFKNLLKVEKSIQYT